jgi:hypothetical protein
MSADLLRLVALDVACLLAAALMLRSWRKRRARPPAVAAVFLVVLAAVATTLVVSGVSGGIVIGPTFIFALLIVMYAARYERRLSSPRR